MPGGVLACAGVLWEGGGICLIGAFDCYWSLELIILVATLFWRVEEDEKTGIGKVPPPTHRARCVERCRRAIWRRVVYARERAPSGKIGDPISSDAIYMYPGIESYPILSNAIYLPRDRTIPHFVAWVGC